MIMPILNEVINSIKAISVPRYRTEIGYQTEFYKQLSNNIMSAKQEKTRISRLKKTISESENLKKVY